MTIKWQNWLIEDYQKGYGYVTKRRIGASKRWKVEGYYIKLSDAAESVFEGRVRAETAKDTVDITDGPSARQCMAMLLNKLDAIAAQLMQELSR